jgi:hypothetical protein
MMINDNHGNNMNVEEEDEEEEEEEEKEDNDQYYIAIEPFNQLYTLTPTSRWTIQNPHVHFNHQGYVYVKHRVVQLVLNEDEQLLYSSKQMITWYCRNNCTSRLISCTCKLKTYKITAINNEVTYQITSLTPHGQFCHPNQYVVVIKEAVIRIKNKIEENGVDFGDAYDQVVTFDLDSLATVNPGAIEFMPSKLHLRSRFNRLVASIYPRNPTDKHSIEFTENGNI